MVERRPQPRLALEASQARLGRIGVQPLHRDLAAEALVGREEHRRHAAGSQAANHPVAAGEHGSPCYLLSLEHETEWGEARP